MSKFGFKSAGQETQKLDFEGPEKKKKASSRSEVDSLLISESAELGYHDRTPKSGNKDMLTKKRKPGRKPPAEPKQQLLISGPVSLINRFKIFCDDNGNLPYWEGLEKLMNTIDKP